MSRTVGADQVVDELVLSFTHDIEMPQLLPGVAPTGKHVRLAFCVVVGFEDGKVAHEHIYWDQASLLVQIGLLDRAGLPVTGAEQAANLLDPRAQPLNALIGRALAGTVYNPAMRRDLPAGTVTFLFTDIEGSTRLLHSLGPDAYAEALAEHRRVLRDAFAAHGGVEIDTQGDAFFVAFPTASGAADAARTAQDDARDPGRSRFAWDCTRERRPSPGRATSASTCTAAPASARSPTVARSFCSPATAALLDGRELPRPRASIGSRTSTAPIRLYQLGSGDFPPLRTPRERRPARLPATRFLGRERELFEAVSLVYEHDPRVLTILGPGGTGKTRFALELARLLAEEADGGTVFCALAPLREPDARAPDDRERLGAASATSRRSLPGSVTGARTSSSTTSSTCCPKSRVRSGSSAAAPELRLLRRRVVSRCASRASASSTCHHSLDDEAIALFVERAHAVRADLEADEHVAELCARLDHLPLALELAAARTKLLSPEALLERLDARLDLLKGTRDADERHATLRATIAWSYDLLDEDEQRLFRRLAVFRGGCTLESAEAVCDADLDTLASLLDKSLVRRRTGALGEERFWMLETIREFALERLEESGEARRDRAGGTPSGCSRSPDPRI